MMPSSLIDRITVVHGDITQQQINAIVNAANPSLLGGGGVDGAIHRAAGPGLREECRLLGGCMTGGAKITRGYNLPAPFVIHTVGPVWHGEGDGEDALLATCYRNSLLLAELSGLRTIAFPAISTGAYGSPLERAAEIAIRTVQEFLADHPAIQTVVFVCHNEEAYRYYSKLLQTGSRVAGEGTLPEIVSAQLQMIESIYQIRIKNRDAVAHRIAASARDTTGALMAATTLNNWVAATGASGDVHVPDDVLTAILRKLRQPDREHPVPENKRDPTDR
jgi:O-acetyl-ADP-ribose deacetylase (regulator of RNase III)